MVTRLVLGLCALTLSGSFAAAQQVLDREHRQEQRIIQGARSGDLTKRGAQILQRQHYRIEKEVHRDRVRNGGSLTRAEKGQVANQLRRESQEIYKFKHNE
jgi:hypothetical protein